MDKYRWLKVERLPSTEIFSQNLMKFLFSRGESFGFIIDLVTENTIKGRYIEKYAYKEIVEDPYGGKFEVDHLDYKTISFKVNSELETVELKNPSIKILDSFNSQLAQANSFEISLEPVRISPFEWASELINTSAFGLYIAEAEIEPTLIQEKVKIKFQAAGEGDIIDTCTNILKDRPAKFSRIKLKSKIKANYFIDIKSSGLVSTSSNLNGSDYEKIARMV